MRIAQVAFVVGLCGPTAACDLILEGDPPSADAAIPDAHVPLCSGDEECADNDPCTRDHCEFHGCENTTVPDDTSCENASLCFEGPSSCQSGDCVGTLPLDCDDENPCTLDSCDDALGCQRADVDDDTPCADADLCNGNETCQLGVCEAGRPLLCVEDGSVCTVESCDALAGCIIEDLGNDIDCSDGVACNGAELCNGAGSCVRSGAVSCLTVGGTILGASGPITLALGTQTLLTSSSTFAFPIGLAKGEHFEVTVETAPAGQHCEVAAATGVIIDAPIDTVMVRCSACGNGTLDPDPIIQLTYEWVILGAPTIPGAPLDLVFSIDDTEVLRSSIAGGHICAGRSRAEISDPGVLALLTNSGIHSFSFATLVGGQTGDVITSWAVVVLEHASGFKQEVELYDTGANIALRNDTCADILFTITTEATVAALVPLVETCDDDNLTGGDGCSPACRTDGDCASDSDGDGLSDCVETNTGIFVGQNDTGTNPVLADTDRDGLSDGVEVLGRAGVDLPALGANPVHKDIFIEADWADDATDCGQHSHQLTATIADFVIAMFAGAPVDNPDGTRGINVHIDGIAGTTVLGGNKVGDLSAISVTGFPDAGEFATLKAANFASAREGLFYYAIVVHDIGSSGGVAALGGDDLLIGMGACDVCATCAGASEAGMSVATTLAHELGHNLGLRHGGDTNCNFKPNYPSIMSYRNGSGGVDIDCDAAADGGIDFSRGGRYHLDEAALDEAEGVCGGPAVDWNESGGIDTGAYQLNINPYASELTDCAATVSAYDDHNDWVTLALGPNPASGGLLSTSMSEDLLPGYLRLATSVVPDCYTSGE